MAVVVLRARSTRLAETLPLMKEVLEQIESLGQGTVTTISNPLLSYAAPGSSSACIEPTARRLKHWMQEENENWLETLAGDSITLPLVHQ